MLATLGDVAPSKNVVKNCLAESKHGRNSIVDEHRSGCSKDTEVCCYNIFVY